MLPSRRRQKLDRAMSGSDIHVVGATAGMQADRTGPALTAGAAVAVLTLVPLAYVASYVVVIGPVDLWQLLARPRIAELLRNTITLAVAAIPEGLPAAVTIVLAIGVAPPRAASIAAAR